MPRTLTSAIKTQFAAPRLAPVMFAEALFLSGYVRMWSGYSSISWNGLTWQGGTRDDVTNPVFVAISTISESAAVEANGIVITASNIPSAFFAKVLAECRQNYPVTIWLGAQDLDSAAIIADPAIAFRGRMDVPQMQDDGATCSVAITVENRLIDLQHQRERRYTHEDQQIDHPGDLGFQFVPQLQDTSLVWGAASAKPASSLGGGPTGPVPIRGPLAGL
jgi:hypothetical protein